MPEVAEVATLTVWTAALACAGGIPRESVAVVEIGPRAMPSAPSTICAQNPIAPILRCVSVMVLYGECKYVCRSQMADSGADAVSAGAAW
jgi:hypothetical protein